jgi:hypothetical protein
MKVTDTRFTLTDHGYDLTRICKLDSGHTVRVRVRRNFYKQQSYAVAEVLSTELTWTNLLSESPESWYPNSPHVTPAFTRDRGKAEALLNRLATDLFARAAAVLAA